MAVKVVSTRPPSLEVLQEAVQRLREENWKLEQENTKLRQERRTYKTKLSHLRERVWRFVHHLEYQVEPHLKTTRKNAYDEAAEPVKRLVGKGKKS